ncbi:hypothetical protein M9Y10_041074 [Tritrichomonas musculus]|uniref:Sel1 repeat family protein n=1 Tax=Tritrichomonas musculus TaxID=1915356 RepID=A0ABR2K3K1_9EUKA
MSEIQARLQNFNKVYSLRKNEIDVFHDFKENEVINIEVLRHSVFRCLFATENDETFQKFVSELGDDKIATLHFKKSMIYDKYISICTDQRVLLIPTTAKYLINTVLSQIKNCEIYCIEEKDRDKLSKYENSSLLQNFASDEKLQELRLTLTQKINDRFHVFNSVQSVMVCYRTTYMTFFYLTEEVISSYYDLIPQPLDFPSESESSTPENQADQPTIIPFYYEEKEGQPHMERSDSQSNPNLNAPLHKVPSLQKKEIDIFRDFQENTIEEIEILPHATFRCLYSTSNNDAFHKFISEIKDDPIATVHCKKSMIYEKYFSFCVDHHVLLLPCESTDQINEFLSHIQNSQIIFVTEKDHDKLSNFENYKLLKSIAPSENLEKLRGTLHSQLNERFEVFNVAQSVMVCYKTTYMTFFYLSEEVISTYYDLKTKPHKFLKTKPDSTFAVEQINDEDIDEFNELYIALDRRIQFLHQNINGNEKYMGTNATLIDVDDLIQITADHQTKKGLSDCIKTYQAANQQIKETEEALEGYINQEKQRNVTETKLPSLNRSLSGKSENSSSSCDSFNIDEDPELKMIKREVESLQTQIKQIDQKIRYSNTNDITPKKPYNSTRMAVPHEPTYSPSSPRRRMATSSPQTVRNRIKALQKKIDEGDVIAMYSLGACYALGDGVPEDKEQAFKYYLLAAEKGNKNAQYAAASCYSYGKGIEMDKNKAFELYLKAAEQGHPKAEFAVAHFFEYGQGDIERNHETAKIWYKKAAAQGHAGAKKFIRNCPSESEFEDLSDN